MKEANKNLYISSQIYLKLIASTSLLAMWYFVITKQKILHKVLETSICIYVHLHDIFISFFFLPNINISLNMLIITVIMKMFEISYLLNFVEISIRSLNHTKIMKIIDIIWIIDKFVFKHLNAKKVLFRKYFKTSKISKVYISQFLRFILSQMAKMWLPITRRKSLIKSITFMQWS